MSNVVLEALQDKKRSLQEQLELVQQAIRSYSSALTQVLEPEALAPKRKARKKAKRHMSPEARAKMSAMMKARWADKKAGVGKAASKRPTQGGKRAIARPASNASSESAS